MAGGSRREWYHSYEWGYSRKLAINNSDQRELERESGERPAGRRARPRALLPRRCSRALLPIGCCPRATSRVFFCRQTWHTHTRSHPHVLHPPHSPVQTKLCRENTDAYPPAGAPAIHRVGTQLYPSPAIPGAARPRATSIRRGPYNTPSTRRPPTTLSTAPAVPAHTRIPHRHKDTALSHKQIVTRGRQYTNYKLKLFRTVLGVKVRVKYTAGASGHLEDNRSWSAPSS